MLHDSARAVETIDTTSVFFAQTTKAVSWNEFLYALIFMSSGPLKTIPVGTVSDLIKADVLFWGPLMASALLGSVPIAVIYTFFVDHYVSGLTAGAVKG